MPIDIECGALIERGLAPSDAQKVTAEIKAIDAAQEPQEVWRQVSQRILQPDFPFLVHEYLYESVFADWDRAQCGAPPAWVPGDISESNIATLMQKAGKETYEELYEWSIRERGSFWSAMLELLDIRFGRKYDSVLDLSQGAENPRWLAGARLNIIESCFKAPDDSPAILYDDEEEHHKTVSIAELRLMTFRVARGLANLGIKAGDCVAIDMPMTVEAVAIYLGAVAAGCSVATIADIFAPHEIKTRLDISQPCCIFVQDYVLRGGRRRPLLERVIRADAPPAIVVHNHHPVKELLREGDVLWQDFLPSEADFMPVMRDPTAATTILFSSGTTAAPKAIPWDHLTPIKAAVDGYLHHDIHPGDVACWPTNLGWMMGPWLVFASLINRATIALYYGAPSTRRFGEFIEKAKVTMLGLVPSLVARWESTGCIKGLDWSHIRAFSSTGECSNAKDMLFLMTLAGYKPIIEYCGGTEIGGGYVTGTVVQPNVPGAFSTPALGSELHILDESGHPTHLGEIFLAPPSMGLSQSLLNGDHSRVYYEGTPRGPQGQILRRHGDQFERLPGGYYRAHGRVDDTMNLSGIKVSSVQIEEIVNSLAGIRETAAIAVTPSGGGPDRLVIYAVLSQADADETRLKNQMQRLIRDRLSPLFKIHEVVTIDVLPRTASNKIIRRHLRTDFVRRREGKSSDG